MTEDPAQRPAGDKVNGGTVGGGAGEREPAGGGEDARAGEAASDGMSDAALVSDLEATLENTRAELAQATDRLLRLAAEYDNYRKRTERERVELVARSQAEIVSRIIDVLDDLERVAHFDANTATAALLEGVQLVEKKMRTVLQSAGLESIEALGAAFDPASMEALATAPAEHPEEEDVVSDIFQSGYRFRGHLVRPARVRVRKYEG
jgi:molecular chaperone GrpE